MKYIPLSVVSIVVAVLLLGPWEVPYGFQTAVQVMPVQAWELVQYPNGSLHSKWYDYKLDGIKDQQLYQFDQGDVVRMEYQLDSLPENWIPANFQVLKIESNRLSEQLIDVGVELKEQKALLNVDLIGEKPETIQRMEEEVRLAEQTLTLLEKQLIRQQALLEEGLISLSEFEQTENAKAEAVLRVEVAKRLLVEERTGEKSQQIDLINTRIAALETTSSFLEGKESLYSIQCPIEGVWRRELSPEGVDHLWVEDTTASIVHFPVRSRDLDMLQDSFQLVLLEGILKQAYTVKEWTQYGPISILNNEQVQWVRLQVPGLRNKWIDGKPIPCRIEVGKLRIWDYLTKAFRLRW
ncbi:MAG: hypothetical protein KDC34_07890 [Saprospiraceae bacterium]|nr:hypothetical protein [Saprospiraceae bacterium]